MRWEEQRKAMQQDAYQKQEVAKYQDQLARNRAEGDHEKQRARNIELVRLQVGSRGQYVATGYEHTLTQFHLSSLGFFRSYLGHRSYVLSTILCCL